jgi:phage-related protein
MSAKPVLWLGSSREDVRSFPPEARQDAGYQLWLVQQGLPPGDWRPMTSVGPSVAEIQIRTRQEHRVFYVAKFEEAIHVLHAFEKKPRKTSDADLNLARHRLREFLATREQRER